MRPSATPFWRAVTATMSVTPSTSADEVELDRLAVHLVGLDLREVEDVVDDREQVVGRGPRDRAPARASSSSRSESRMRSRLPMTPFIGVRISWLIVARNSDLTTDARSAASRASASRRSAARRSVMSWTNVTKNLLTGASSESIVASKRELAAVAAPAGALDPAPAKVLRVAAQALEDVDPNLAVTPRDEVSSSSRRRPHESSCRAARQSVELHDLPSPSSIRIASTLAAITALFISSLASSAARASLRIGDVVQHHANPDHLAVALGANRRSGRFDPAHPAVGQCDAMPATLRLPLRKAT